MLTTAGLTKDPSDCKIRQHRSQFHPFFLHLSSYAHCTRNILLAIIHTPSNLFATILIDIVLIRSYQCHPCCQHPHRHRTHRVTLYCTTSQCHLESCTNNLTKHVNFFATSYSRISLPPASSSLPSSLTSYSSDRTDTTQAASILIKIVVIVSYCTTSPCLSLE